MASLAQCLRCLHTQRLLLWRKHLVAYANRCLPSQESVALLKNSLALLCTLSHCFVHYFLCTNGALLCRSGTRWPSCGFVPCLLLLCSYARNRSLCVCVRARACRRSLMTLLNRVLVTSAWRTCCVLVRLAGLTGHRCHSCMHL